MDERQALAAFGALSQETRLRILRMLVVAGPDGIAAAIIAYCRAHPKRQVADAAADFFGP